MDIYNGVTDAIEALKDNRPEEALKILIESQQEADEEFMDDSEGAEEAFLRGCGKKP